MSSVVILDTDVVPVPDISVLQEVLRAAFHDLGNGHAVQPAQDVVALPGGGDVITYRGLMAGPPMLAVKLSPYLPQPDGAAVVTAWTLLLDVTTGQPLALLDSKALTTERTAATTALAVDLLATPQARRLAVIGAGAIAAAHVRHVAGVRAFSEVRVYSRRGPTDPRIAAMGPTVSAAASAQDAIRDADVVLLCTSAAEPVIDVSMVGAGTVVTSVSTNAPRAHEISPAALPTLEVYCDYTPSTVATAGEMLIAIEQDLWDTGQVRGDLPTVLTGSAPRPSGGQPVFFRSIGLGIEDAAVAIAALETYRKAHA